MKNKIKIQRYQLALINDPLGEFKFAEKRENELENHFDKKIQTNKDRESEHHTTKSRPRGNEETKVGPTEEKKKKNQFDEVN